MGNYTNSLKGLSQRYNKVGKSINRTIATFSKQMGELLRSEAVKKTPVDTGHLRRSWEVSEAKQEGDVTWIEIRNPAKYALWVEKGHAIVDRTGQIRGFNDGVHMLRDAIITFRVIYKKQLKSFIAALIKKLEEQ